ncbi:hypothetical protein [Aquirhabdus sp.]|uniref:hypothetical protein n=1 Tax=Aquirhabdus sp. TaxID=2824160 RepID=UPI00396C77E8
MMGRIVLIGWAALAIIVIGLFLGFQLYTHILAGLTLSDQPGFLQLPKSITGTASATNDIAIKLKGRIDAEVPVKQDLQLPLHGVYQANISLDTHVPLRFTINYKGDVDVHAYADIVGTTELVTQRHWYLPTFPLKARVPLDFKLPISLSVPVDTQIRFVYNGPLTLKLNQTLTSPIDTVLRTYLMVDRNVSTPILASFGMRFYPPQTPLPVLVKYADLKLPLSSLRIQRTRQHDR